MVCIYASISDAAIIPQLWMI